MDLWFRTLVRAAIFCCLCLPLLACETLPKGEYRFQTEFERDPMAFRSGSRPEALAVNVKFQNLSDKRIAVAEGAGGAGVVLTAALNSPSPAYFGTPQVITGYRAGVRLRGEQDASHPLWFDRHGTAVDRLAEVGPTLLHLNEDNIRSDLGLLSNEADFNIVVPVNWDQVPTSPFVVPVDLELTLQIAYLGPRGEHLNFPAPLQRRVTAYLVNGRRYATGTMPAPNGPVSGEFTPSN